MGQDRCLWAPMAYPGRRAWISRDEMGLKDATKKKLLHDNAAELFGLS